MANANEIHINIKSTKESKFGDVLTDLSDIAKIKRELEIGNDFWNRVSTVHIHCPTDTTHTHVSHNI